MSSDILDINESMFYNPNQFPLIGIDIEGAPNMEKSFHLSHQAIEYFRKKKTTIKLDNEEFENTLTRIFRGGDHKLKIRAILVFFMLKNIIDVSKVFPTILTEDVLLITQDIQEGQDENIIGRESKYFTNDFFNELKKDQFLMLDVIEVIYHFIKEYSIQYECIYPIINNIILSNEDSVTPLLTKQLNFMDDDAVPSKYKSKIQEHYPIIIPFNIKYNEYTEAYKPKIEIPFLVSRESIREMVFEVFDLVASENVSIDVHLYDGEGNQEFINHAFLDIVKSEVDLFERRKGYYWFKYHNKPSKELLRQYHNVGKLLSYAINRNYKIPIRFPRYFYKKLMHRDISLVEIAFFDHFYFYLIDRLVNEPEKVKDIEFRYDDMISFYIIDLKTFEDVTDKEDHEFDMVTPENSAEFIKKLTEWVFIKSIEKEFEAFEEGFNELRPNDMFYHHFRLDELDMIVSEKDEWMFIKENATYQTFTKDSQTIKWFWEYFDKLDNKKKIKLIFDSPKIPDDIELEDIKLKIRKEKKHAYYDSEKKILSLPEFTTYNELEKKCNEDLFD